MINQDLIINWLLTYKYFVLFPIMVVEGPLANMAAGFLTSLSIFNPFIALPIIIAGDVTGDVIYYFIGYFAHSFKWALWITHKLGFEKHRERVIKSFQDHGGKLLLLGKLTHALGMVFLVGAGYSKISLKKFIWYNTLGTIIKSSALLGVGYLAGAAYQTYHAYFEYGSFIISIGSLILVGLFYYFFHKFSVIDKKEYLE